ncbi:MAG: hypothetical protein GY758_31525 [Fuerstiella sp.]|nr:hypothetical protein [Fuerstiella sp.]MCP4788506.1 hypothetical protein [Fuerstiella sp.]MCP4859053.1 hypothetical protein [Fuerstiella sp.]
MGIWKYIKAAFSNRWNLLAVAGGIGFSVLSGRPEVGLPLLAAVELAWLGFVGTHSRFRQFIDIKEHQQLKEDDAKTAETRMRRMLTSLPRGAQRRFELLMSQCEEMRNITKQYQAAHGAEETESMFAEVRVDGLDRLLWLFLKLLYTENSLNRFFETTTIDAIERELRQVNGRIERERSRPENRQRERIMATLEDNRQTCEQRRVNFEQARDSYELVRAEQKRLENKIRSLTETGISKGDPGLLSTEVDAVAGSIRETEKTLSELQFVTGFATFENEAVPEIVTRKVVTG